VGFGISDMYMKDKKVKQVIFSVDNTGRYEEMVKGCDVFCIHV
jgi:isoleucyl-tRNA synthetase